MGDELATAALCGRYRNLVRCKARSYFLAGAERDDVLPPSAAAHMGDYVSDLETVVVEGSGHWTQQEKPDQVNRMILDWLDRRFPLLKGE